jgi:uncharacterized protein (DUF2141 family)
LIRSVRRLALAGVALALIGAAPVGTVAVEITGVRSAKGVVHVDLCPQAQFLKDGCRLSGDAPARIGVTTVIVSGVPAGRYAAQVFHDENRNGKVDRALFGIPKEGIGFSRDAPIRMAPPKWEDALFDTSGGRQAIRLKMRYMLGGSGPKS